MKRIRKAFAVITPVFMLSLLGVGVSAAPASAAGCYGWNCHGYDLYHFGCTYTSTTYGYAVSGGVTLATVYNQYSGGCKSNWAEAQLSSAAVAAGDKMYIQISTTDSQGDPEVMTYPGDSSNAGQLDETWNGGLVGGSTSSYTDMVDGTNITYANVFVYNANGQLITISTTAKQ